MVYDRASPWPEDAWVPISALEHYSYCPRQCALIHREQTFDENLFTLRGRAVHERVDEGAGGTPEAGVRVERSVPLWSARLGLVGRADVVEFRGRAPYPVEYKSGRPVRVRHAALQLCAQALCLEEMLGVQIPAGALYFAAARRRRDVAFTPELRAAVASAVQAVREILAAERLPPPVADARCPPCSLIDACYPFVLARKGRIAALQRKLFTPLEAPREEGR